MPAPEVPEWVWLIVASLAALVCWVAAMRQHAGADAREIEYLARYGAPPPWRRRR